MVHYWQDPWRFLSLQPVTQIYVCDRVVMSELTIESSLIYIIKDLWSHLNCSCHLSEIAYILKNSPFCSLFTSSLSLLCRQGSYVSSILNTCFWKQRSVEWKSPTEAFKGCGSQVKSNIWVWSIWEVHCGNLFIPCPQMRIYAAVRMHLRVLGIGPWQVTGCDTQ